MYPHWASAHNLLCSASSHSLSLSEYAFSSSAYVQFLVAASLMRTSAASAIDRWSGTRCHSVAPMPLSWSLRFLHVSSAELASSSLPSLANLPIRLPIIPPIAIHLPSSRNGTFGYCTMCGDEIHVPFVPELLTGSTFIVLV